uniref:EF-hand domain-containing protein n=1 Tax=Electrophorus electricus TaxID=8005 RepID=A0A4W4DYJ5_ELEEL
METSEACDPYSRPARRTQWIVSTLAYHYGLDRGVENEIIVLATGLDQYLQEIFHHLDCQGEGRIPAEDFIILCDILGLSKESEVEECVGMLDSIPSELTFRQFHAKLCGYFSTKAGRPYENGRLLVGRDSEHIETQIRLRSPLRRREKLLTLAAGACTREIGKLEEENASLRELVEDMRAALQSSDARSLALQVGLWKSHSKRRPDSGCFTARHELHASRETVLVLEECNRTLRTEQVGMRRKAEEAREALRSGLAKVKELEAKARRVPALQKHLQQIEMELLYYR